MKSSSNSTCSYSAEIDLELLNVKYVSFCVFDGLSAHNYVLETGDAGGVYNSVTVTIAFKPRQCSPLPFHVDKQYYFVFIIVNNLFHH